MEMQPGVVIVGMPVPATLPLLIVLSLDVVGREIATLEPTDVQANLLNTGGIVTQIEDSAKCAWFVCVRLEVRLLDEWILTQMFLKEAQCLSIRWPSRPWGLFG
ncbi:hypothetical protein [Halomicrobium sp. LC1Hm]|uniref:hypothetical protein n=1 Tax=Halomicrobium sp. LC1Hm TaxID=2610902 RepID=UPI0012984C8E|nr:hypothetical protein [Halomicrobium sp. LC1Hm]